MVKFGKNTLSSICLIVGAALIISAAAYGVYALVSSKGYESDNQKILALADELMPPVKNAYVEERGNSAMPVMELDGVNVVGIIEMPAYNAKLPVRANWNAKASKSIPCLYDGSVYDRNLLIGTVDTKGQFDFASDLSVDKLIYFTDMNGDRFSYSVSSIKHADKLNAAEWAKEKADLTVFVKDTFSGEYTVIYCMVKVLTHYFASTPFNALQSNEKLS